MVCIFLFIFFPILSVVVVARLSNAYLSNYKTLKSDYQQNELKELLFLLKKKEEFHFI